MYSRAVKALDLCSDGRFLRGFESNHSRLFNFDFLVGCVMSTSAAPLDFLEQSILRPLSRSKFYVEYENGCFQVWNSTYNVKKIKNVVVLPMTMLDYNDLTNDVITRDLTNFRFGNIDFWNLRKILVRTHVSYCFVPKIPTILQLAAHYAFPLYTPLYTYFLYINKNRY